MSDQRVDFADRVMAAVGEQPAPSATQSFLTAVRSRSLGDALSAFSVAWHLGTVRRWRVGRRVRLQAIALVMSVLVALGFGSIATATAVITGVNEIGNAINHQSGTNDGGGVQNSSPDPEASQHGQGRGAQNEQTDNGSNSADGNSGSPGPDEPGGNQEGGEGGQGADGAGGDSGGGQGDATP
jgi:hypothetical protein